MTLILQIAAGVALGLILVDLMRLFFAWVVSVWQDEIRSRPWVLWTLGITGVGIYLVWLLDRPR